MFYVAHLYGFMDRAEIGTRPRVYGSTMTSPQPPWYQDRAAQAESKT